MNLADRIQALRKAKGISQEELADKIGVSRQAVSKWESEQSSPDMEKIILLSDYFDTTTDYLLKGVEPVEGIKKTNKRKIDSINKILCLISILS
ncbi:MAG: helix-turn-helix domain-containing protein, partial [Erysipelotrichaceae bacterium]|nr:helix-turn-helix domain-containing protein [Erysipelotrichaceae bacterium]